MSKQKYKTRPRRKFSEEFKKGVVHEIETCVLTVMQASEEYRIANQVLYNWLYKYSTYVKKGAQIVVEKKSEALKSKELRRRVAELEQILGQKQLKIDFLEKLIEVANDELDLDLKKNYGSK